MKRAWGLVPVAGVGWAAADHAAAGTLPAVLWSCNAAALALGVALLAGAPHGRAAWAGTVVLAASLPAWLRSVATGGETGLHGVAVHVAALGVGVAAVRRAPPPPDVVPTALAGLALVTLSSRWLTPPALGVNAAHAPWPALLALSAAAAGGVWVAHAGLRRLAPAADPLADALAVHPDHVAPLVAHFARASRRGPGHKPALRAFVRGR